MKLKMKVIPPTEKFNLDWAHYSKENREFLRLVPNAVFDCCVIHNMNYYRLPNGFLVHVYHCYEVESD